MKEIKLSNSTEVILVDDEDFEEFNKFVWRLDSKRQYARRTTTKGGPAQEYRMHTEIMKPKKGELVDHIDRNKLNNQRSNLRIVTQSQNSINKKSRTGSSSQYLGVSKTKSGFQVVVNGKYIGTYKDEEMAAKAYDTKASELFGEFANLNFKQ